MTPPTFLNQWQAAHSNCTVIRNESNRGFAGGNNQGLAVARANTSCCFNNDTVVTAGWLEACSPCTRGILIPACVGPVSIAVSGAELNREAATTIISPRCMSSPKRHVLAMPPNHLEVVARLSYVCSPRKRSSPASAVRTKPSARAYFEDDDFCLRARFAGFRIAPRAMPLCIMTAARLSPVKKLTIGRSLQRNREMFRTKWNLPAGATLEPGLYNSETTAARLCAQAAALPLLAATHVTLAPLDGKAAGNRVPPTAKPAPVAEFGRLDEARDTARAEEFPGVVDGDRSPAISKRQFHPESVFAARGNCAGRRRGQGGKAVRPARP